MTVSLRYDRAFFLEKSEIIKCCLRLPESVARQHGAILESIFPATGPMTGEEVKALLLSLSRLPQVQEMPGNKPENTASE